MNDDDDVNMLYISGMDWRRTVTGRGIRIASCIGVLTERMCIVRERDKMGRRIAPPELLLYSHSYVVTVEAQDVSALRHRRALDVETAEFSHSLINKPRRKVAVT